MKIMKEHFLFIFSILFLMTLSSCQTKEERVIQKMESLSARIEKDGENFEKEDWDVALQEYQQLQKDAADCDFSSEQLRELGRVEYKLTAIMTREGAKSFGRGVGDALQNGNQVLKGVIDGINESFQGEK